MTSEATKTPGDEWELSEPTFNRAMRYWETTAISGQKNPINGRGSTPEEARADARRQIKERSD